MDQLPGMDKGIWLQIACGNIVHLSVHLSGIVWLTTVHVCLYLCVCVCVRVRWPPLWCLCVCVDWQPVSTASAHTWQASETFQLGLFGLKLHRRVAQQSLLPEPEPEPRRSPWPGIAGQRVQQQGGTDAELYSLLCPLSAALNLLRPCLPSPVRLFLWLCALGGNSRQGVVASRQLTAGMERDGGMKNDC